MLKQRVDLHVDAVDGRPSRRDPPARRRTPPSAPSRSSRTRTEPAGAGASSISVPGAFASNVAAPRCVLDRVERVRRLQEAATHAGQVAALIVRSVQPPFDCSHECVSSCTQNVTR
jgi:hypothetical protein